jgi:hypothetical protein
VQQILDGTAKFSSSRADSGFKDSFNEKNRSYSWPKNEKISAVAPEGRRSSIKAGHLHSGSREVRNLPFEKDTFRDICKRFFIHPSIARVISRADVPLFSRAQVKIGSVDSEGGSQLAFGVYRVTYLSVLCRILTSIVYNCRSSNIWKNDLALTVTYFPRSKIIFGIFFGCTAAVETQILNRIASTEEQAFHPMLLPGIFAELERTRMVEIVETTIDEIEVAIHDLDSGVNNTSIELLAPEFYEQENAFGTRHGRRRVWLNTNFLRNRLQIWKTQLAKMIAHVDELLESDVSYARYQESEYKQAQSQVDDAAFKQTSVLIKDRLQALIEEFQDKIEDCTISIDGMTIATQWVSSSSHTRSSCLGY